MTTLNHALNDLILRDENDRSAVAAQAVAVARGEHRLRDGLEELLRLHILSPERLAHAVERLAARARAHVVLGLVGRADEVGGAEEDVAVLGHASDHGLGEVGAESTLVEHRLAERGERLAGDLALLAELVHVEAELELGHEGLLVGAEAGEADGAAVVDEGDLGHVHGDGLELLAQAHVGGNGEALLAGHGDDGTTVVLGNGHFFFFF